MTSHTPVTRLCVRLAVIVFRLFFSRRIKIALDNLARSTIHNDLARMGKSETQLINESLDHLALTVYRSLERIFIKKRIFCELEQEDIYSYLRRKNVSLETEVELNALMNEKRGLIFVSAHIGAWEDLIDLGHILHKPTFLLSKRMKIQWLQSLWEASRTHKVKRLDHGARARRIVRELKEGSVIADVLDQHCPHHQALICHFLGRRAATSTDLSRFALLSDALIVPIFLVRTEVGHHHLYIHEVIDPNVELRRGRSKEDTIKYMTQKCCEQIEKVIRLHPEQWMWIHRRWKVD